MFKIIELECTPQREPIRRANDGVMKVILDQNVFQYSIPKLIISGKLSVPSLSDKSMLSIIHYMLLTF